MSLDVYLYRTPIIPCPHCGKDVTIAPARERVFDEVDERLHAESQCERPERARSLYL